MVCMKLKSGVLRLALAGNAALCAERSRNDSISCCEEHKLHSHVQPSFAEPGAIPKSQGPAVADAQSPGKVGLHPARTGLAPASAARRIAGRDACPTQKVGIRPNGTFLRCPRPALPRHGGGAGLHTLAHNGPHEDQRRVSRAGRVYHFPSAHRRATRGLKTRNTGSCA